MRESTVRDLQSILSLMLSNDVDTLDELVEEAGLPESVVVDSYNLISEIYESISGRVSLKKAWAIQRDIDLLERASEGLTKDLDSAMSAVGKDKSVYDLRSLRKSITETLSITNKLRSEFENILGHYTEREKLDTIYQAIFEVLCNEDPLLAIRVRQELILKMDELSVMLPELGGKVGR